jgi:hypothetical protein
VRKVLAIYGVGSKIQIVRGDRTYSITEPGGKTQVIVTKGTAPSAASAGDGSLRTGSPLADLARRSAVARGLAASPPPAAPAPLLMSPIPASVTAELVYYRFVDPDGTVHITRLRPETYPYDVLSP